MSNKTRNQRHRLLLQDYPADDTVDLVLEIASGGNVSQATTPLWPTEANLGGTITRTELQGFSNQSIAIVAGGTEPLSYTYTHDGGASTSDFSRWHYESDNGKTRIVNFIIKVV